MWAIQYNQSTSQFELTQDGMTVLELSAKEVEQISQATIKVFLPCEKVKVVKNVA